MNKSFMKKISLSVVVLMAMIVLFLTEVGILYNTVGLYLPNVKKIQNIVKGNESLEFNKVFTLKQKNNRR